jgi:hypothetical protein
MLSQVPAAFVPNLGQWEHPARFVAHIAGASVFLEEGGFVLSVPKPAEDPVRGVAVRMRFEGAAPAEPLGEGRLAGVHNYFLGNDPSKWKTDVPLYGAVRYRGLWPGVEVRFYEKEGHLEYDLVLSPGAALASVEFAVEGAEGLRLDEDGALLIERAVGPLLSPRPLTFEVDEAGRRRESSARYEMRGPDRFGFVVREWGGECELVLDPGLLWSTFVGGASDDSAQALSVDASGVLTLTGYTYSADYPTSPGAWDTTNNGSDVFVTRLDPSQPASQQLLYSTFVGGTDADDARAISVDAMGVVTIAGRTYSADFPTTPGAWDATYNGGSQDSFVTRLDPSQPASQQLLYSTFVGGASQEQAYALCVDPSGIGTIAGYTKSPNFRRPRALGIRRSTASTTSSSRDSTCSRRVRPPMGPRPQVARGRSRSESPRFPRSETQPSPSPAGTRPRARRGSSRSAARGSRRPSRSSEPKSGSTSPRRRSSPCSSRATP